MTRIRRLICGAALAAAALMLPIAAQAQLAVQVQPPSGSGASVYVAQGGTTNALLTASTVTVKSIATTLFDVVLTNTGTAAAYVQLFNGATATLGTTAPAAVLYVGAGATVDYSFGSLGWAFPAGLTVAATTTPTGSTAPATGINADIGYQ